MVRERRATDGVAVAATEFAASIFHGGGEAPPHLRAESIFDIQICTSVGSSVRAETGAPDLLRPSSTLSAPSDEEDDGWRPGLLGLRASPPSSATTAGDKPHLLSSPSRSACDGQRHQDPPSPSTSERGNGRRPTCLEAPTADDDDAAPEPGDSPRTSLPFRILHGNEELEIVSSITLSESELSVHPTVSDFSYSLMRELSPRGGGARLRRRRDLSVVAPSPRGRYRRPVDSLLTPSTAPPRGDPTPVATHAELALSREERAAERTSRARPDPRRLLRTRGDCLLDRDENFNPQSPAGGGRRRARKGAVGEGSVLARQPPPPPPSTPAARCEIERGLVREAPPPPHYHPLFPLCPKTDSA